MLSLFTKTNHNGGTSEHAVRSLLEYFQKRKLKPRLDLSPSCGLIVVHKPNHWTFQTGFVARAAVVPVAYSKSHGLKPNHVGCHRCFPLLGNRSWKADVLPSLTCLLKLASPRTYLGSLSFFRFHEQIKMGTFSKAFHCMSRSSSPGLKSNFWNGELVFLEQESPHIQHQCTKSWAKEHGPYIMASKHIFI